MLELGMNYELKVFAIASMLLATLPTHGEVLLRCGSNMVETGDSKATVTLYCGEPLHKEHSGASCTTGENKVKCSNDEEWTYNPGSGQFLTTLIFQGNTLIGMRRGARVP
jgi:hypothetical protein